ncbi:hypothetical protein PLESTB_001787500 [Pleodorina starrii]|uniref:Uncharacterized protein n=1 Tax=Pleodorina starrii TaxID=330485 RepID=A0A9W6C1B3_9CHLO|nr:hypothetical protein PLESTB_001787500 [Pleodorina starrii]GLC76525.1 hypothetical protein PLESTF_001792500 [Pleodorina starrii]
MSQRGSYYEIEQLAERPGRLGALVSFVKRGGTLILLDGWSAAKGRNSLVQLLAAVLGSDPRCTPVPVTNEQSQNLRISTSFFESLEPKIKPLPGMGLSNMQCQNGTAIYSAFVKKVETSAAMLWPLGKGGVYWIGSSFTRPNIRGYQQVCERMYCL